MITRDGQIMQNNMPKYVHTKGKKSYIPNFGFKERGQGMFAFHVDLKFLTDPIFPVLRVPKRKELPKLKKIVPECQNMQPKRQVCKNGIF
jgi:hypothetical protein